MTVIKRQSPSGYVICCDEIRQETNGKLIFIGVYPGNDMTVFGESWPLTIQKLFLIIGYLENKDTFLSMNEIQIFLPGDTEPSFRFPPPSQDISQTSAPSPPLEDDGERMKGLMSYLGLSPLEIKKEGRIRVVAQIGDDSFTLGSLYVRRAPAPTANT